MVAAGALLLAVSYLRVAAHPPLLVVFDLGVVLRGVLQPTGRKRRCPATAQTRQRPATAPGRHTPANYRQLGSQISRFQVDCEIGIPVRTGYSHAKFAITSAT